MDWEKRCKLDILNECYDLLLSSIGYPLRHAVPRSFMGAGRNPLTADSGMLL